MSTASFAEFYRSEHASQVRRAKLLLGFDDMAADVVQDAFVALYQRWDTIAEPGPFLSRVVLNGCRDRTRRRRRLQNLLPILHDGNAHESEHEVLWDVLQALPYNHRVVIVLKFYEDRSESEVAELMDCSVGSVGPWTHRALASMRKALK